MRSASITASGGPSAGPDRSHDAPFLGEHPWNALTRGVSRPCA